MKLFRLKFKQALSPLSMPGLVDTSDLLEMAGYADDDDAADRKPAPVVPDLIASWSKFHNNRKPISDLSGDSTRSNIALIQGLIV